MANPGKFQCMLLGKHKSLKIEIEEFQLEPPKSVNLLGIKIDTHVSNICKTAIRIRRLSRIRNALDKKLAKILCNSFVLSQLNYCSIIWMF